MQDKNPNTKCRNSKQIFRASNFEFIFDQKGQVLLIVVLIMVIALTVGLSLVSRSVINLKNTNENVNSQKAFGAAEAGVEIGLQKPYSVQDIPPIGPKTLDNGAIITQVLIHSLAGSSIILNAGDPVAQDEGIDVWLTNYPNYSGSPWSGKMYVYWGANNGCKDAAIEAIVISGTSATDPNATIQRYGIDPCGTVLDPSQNRIGDNKFSAAVAGSTINGHSYRFSTALAITNGIIVRLVPFYANSPIAIVGYDNGNPPALQAFPAQGRIITAIGTFATTQREVSFFQGYPILPSEFFYAFFQK